MTFPTVPSGLPLLFDAAPLGIAILDAQGRVVDANPAFRGMTGREAEDLRGRSAADLAAPDDRPGLAQWLAGAPSAQPQRFTLQRPDGSTLVCSLTASAIELEGRPGAVAFFQDVTEQVTAEQEQRRLAVQVQQAQKMEAIGTLAGGIAHDFNNLLMAIQGSISLLMLDKPAGHRDVPYLKNIEKTVARAAELTRQILGFARGGKYEVKATDLNALVRVCADLFGRSKRDIRVRQQLAPDLWTVEVDSAQVQQALLNLLVNAGQAMPEGGDLDLETANIVVDALDPDKPRDAAPGPYVRTTVTDTGVGIPEEILGRIFEPFFTTGEKGKHSGLGLSSTFGIVKAHAGYITVRSDPGRGATFSIHLPAAPGTVQHPAAPVPAAVRRRTILLVEDEELVLEVGRQMLERLGHTVITARSGAEALAIYERDPAAIDIVILDMIMPGMGGGPVFDRLKAIRPEVVVLLSSGYSLNGQAMEIMKRGCRGFIQKPFSLDQLDRKIRAIAAVS
jgi:two-component system, cell cycle sensor histidine kinase and response regulator CckA